MPTTWSWRHWAFFGLALIAVAGYFELITRARVEHVLERLALQSESAGTVFGQDAGRAEALFIVFAFLFLTPVVFAMGAFVPLFASAVAAEFMFSITRLPQAAGALLFWIALTVTAWMKVDAWLPGVQWLGSLIARAFLIALRAR
ncbi:MAG TPA: hypothetical protein VLF19_07565 [Methylomirabilota bacterium]|nr:hypothetical protein [Methylomirabilota bacterium]